MRRMRAICAWRSVSALANVHCSNLEKLIIPKDITWQSNLTGWRNTPDPKNNRAFWIYVQKALPCPITFLDLHCFQFLPLELLGNSGMSLQVNSLYPRCIFSVKAIVGYPD